MRGSISALPAYKANEGGGAITIGTKITLTENFYSKDLREYGFTSSNGQWISTSYGNDFNFSDWVDLLSHEVGHLPQAQKYGGDNPAGKVAYAVSFLLEYATTGGHDDAPREKEAEKGANSFRAFNTFVDNEFGQDAIKNLIQNDKLTDEKKIDRIHVWYDAYQQKTQPSSNGNSNSGSNSNSNSSQGTTDDCN